MNRSICLVVLFLLILPVGAIDRNVGDIYISDVKVYTVRSGPAPETIINLEFFLYSPEIDYDAMKLLNCGIHTEEIIFFTDTGIYNTSDQLFASCRKDQTQNIYDNITYFGSLSRYMTFNVGFDMLKNVTIKLTQQTGKENISREFTFSYLRGGFQDYFPGKNEVIDQTDGDWYGNTEQDPQSYIQQDNVTVNDLIPTVLQLNMQKDNYLDITLLKIDYTVKIDNKLSDPIKYSYILEDQFMGLKMKNEDNLSYLKYSKIPRATTGIIKTGRFSSGISKVDSSLYIAIVNSNQTVLYDGKYTLTPIQGFWLIDQAFTTYSTKMTVSNGEISLISPFVARTTLQNFIFGLLIGGVIILTIVWMQRKQRLKGSQQ